MPIYMQFAGIEGDSSAQGHERWHEIFSFSWGESNSPVTGGGGGGGAGRVSMSDLNVTLRSGKGSPQFAFACANGNFLPAVQMDVVLPSAGENVVYQRWTLSNAFITSYQTGGSGGEAPTESLSLNFTKIKFEQAVQSATGAVRYQVFFWDVRANQGSVIP